MPLKRHKRNIYTLIKQKKTYISYQNIKETYIFFFYKETQGVTPTYCVPRIKPLKSSMCSFILKHSVILVLNIVRQKVLGLSSFLSQCFVYCSSKRWLRSISLTFTCSSPVKPAILVKKIGYYACYT